MTLKKNPPPENVLVSWPASAFPSTIFAIVGDVQRLSPGIDFGCLRLATWEHDSCAVLSLCEDSYLPGEVDVGHMGFLTVKGVRYFWLDRLPRRFSYLLGKTRLLFPGIGFDMIRTSIASEPRSLRLSKALISG